MLNGARPMGVFRVCSLHLPLVAFPQWHHWALERRRIVTTFLWPTMWIRPPRRRSSMRGSLLIRTEGAEEVHDIIRGGSAERSGHRARFAVRLTVAEKLAAPVAHICALIV